MSFFLLLNSRRTCASRMINLEATSILLCIFCLYATFICLRFELRR